VKIVAMSSDDRTWSIASASSKVWLESGVRKRAVLRERLSKLVVAKCEHARAENNREAMRLMALEGGWPGSVKPAPRAKPRPRSPPQHVAPLITTRPQPRLLRVQQRNLV
jgi:hypothetical protein